jgi:predicted DNA-binding transcriptional regulator AlpA
MPITDNMRRSVSIPELARMHGVSEALLYRLAGERRLPGCRRVGHRFIVHLETFEEWVKSGTGDEQAQTD